jgi:type IV pilus assembly protein PilQ
MTLTKGLALLVTVATAGALVNASGTPTGSTATPTSTVRLKAISARVGSKGASLVIEATEPVAYIQSRPDPLTLLLDFRNVGAEGVANTVASTEKSPIAGVSIESAESMGAPASRVRIALAQPVVHRVRSERNTIVVDFEKASAKGVPYVLPPAATSSRGRPASDAPDAMMALRQDSGQALRQDAGQALQTRTDSDPIAALGLDAPSPASQASAAQATPAPAARAKVDAASTAPRAVVKVVSMAASGAAAPQATAPPQQPPVPTEQPGTGRKYTGHPISLDFQGADLRAVLRTFAEISGLNIVIDPAVQGTVDVALRDVPWDQALDIILRANKLGYFIDGTIVRIAPLTVLAEEESQRRKLGEEQALAGQLVTIPVTLSYAKAEELQALITKSALSQRGTVQVDTRTNTLIITDLAERLTQARDLVATLDKPQPQVEIEARIVQTNKDYARALGVQWGFGGRVDPALGNTTNLAFPNNGNLAGRVGGTQGPVTGATQTAQPTAVNLGVTGPNSAVGLALGSINGAFNLDVALSALERSGNGRLLSTPRVTTQNNIAAEMKQGVQIPIQTVANNTVTVTFKDAALSLKVTPQITAANTVIMQIAVENASPDFSRAVNNIPPINTQMATTQVLVSDGQTTVIGGIYVSQEQASNDRTPGLSKIPLLKWLFQRNTLNDQSTELLIFITPRIIKS